MHELVIRAGSVLDGSGRPAVAADLAIEDGRVAEVRTRASGGQAARLPARRTIDADGLVLAPGFIDMHSHADFTLPAYPDATNSLAQGVTTEVVGNCGFSPAPLSGDPRFHDVQRAAGHGLGPHLKWDWRSFGDFLARLDDSRPAVNCVALVGHGMLRLGVVGAQDRPATRSELDAMRAAVSDALADGAWGLSTGLVYPPGCYASTDEIVEVARPLAGTGSLYASHIRDEGEGLAGALAEAVEVGRRLGVPVEVSHLKAAGKANHGRAGEALAILDGARSAGVHITQDAYPYQAGSTLLSQLIPPWAHAGGTDALMARLRSPEARARIARDLRDGLPGWANFSVASGGWEHISIASVAGPELTPIEGLTIAEAARRAAQEPLDFVLDTLAADRAATTMVVELMDEDDVARILKHPSTAIGSDQLGVSAVSARVHPRSYGTFARFLGRHVRERGDLELAEAIRRITGLPAAILGLHDRGRIVRGAIGDLVLFDPSRVSDAATYEQPTRPPVGIEAVVVGGEIAVQQGRIVNARLGRVLRREEGK